MNNPTRALFAVVTAATAVAALAAGMLLALHAPAPQAQDFHQPLLTAGTTPEEA